MNAKNTLSITARNLRLTFKLILFITVLAAITLAVLISVFTPLFNELKTFIHDRLTVEDVSWAEIVKIIGEHFEEFFSTNKSEVFRVLGYTYLIIFIARFLASTSLMPTGYIVGNQMKTNFTENFVPSFIVTFKDSFLYSLFSSLIVLVLDVPFSMLVFYLVTLTFSQISFYAITIAVILLLAFLSVRMTITALWIPNVVIGKMSVGKAFKKTILDTPKTFKKTIVGVAGILSFAFISIMTTIIPTLFIGPIIVLPISIILFTSFSMVVYCDIFKQNYFYDSKNSMVNEVVEDKE